MYIKFCPSITELFVKLIVEIWGEYNVNSWFKSEIDGVAAFPFLFVPSTNVKVDAYTFKPMFVLEFFVVPPIIL